MKLYSIYSGMKILRNLGCTEDVLALNLGQDESYIEGMYNSEEYYVDNHEAKQRPALALESKYEFTVSIDYSVGVVPENTSIFIDGIIVGESDESELILNFSVAKTYDVKVEPPFPYKPAAFQVNVHEVQS
jgi:hypothetical protein